MSKYRLLEPHYVANQYLEAGTTQSTADVGGILPTGWLPTNNVDPLDLPAVNAFHAAGPQRPGLARGQFGFVASPATYWVATQLPGLYRSWQLVGLGAALPTITLPTWQGP
jgi:hypothetical protein